MDGRRLHPHRPGRCCGRVVGHTAGRQPATDDHGAESGYLKTKIRDTLSRYFFQQTKRRPMIMPIVLEV